MSRSAPSDLSIVFRGLPRRHREARADAPAFVTTDYDKRIDELVADAARQLSCPADAAAIADAIDARSADDWTEQHVGQLQATALEVGATLRALQAATELSFGNERD
jgi:hypothetical protein